VPEQKEDCAEQKITTTHQTVIPYDGSDYRLPGSVNKTRVKMAARGYVVLLYVFIFL